MKRILFVLLFVCAVVGVLPETEDGGSILKQIAELDMRLPEFHMPQSSDYLVNRVKTLEKYIFEFHMRLHETTKMASAVARELVDRDIALETRLAELEFLIGEGINNKNNCECENHQRDV